MSLGFDENAAKGGGAGSGVVTPGKGNPAPDRSTASTPGGMASGSIGASDTDDPLAKEKKEMDEFNEEFWKKIGKLQEPKTRVKGSTLRSGGSAGTAAPPSSDN